MGAHAAEHAAPPEVGPRPEGRADEAGGLVAALMAGARLHPQRTALRDAGDRAVWCGRPAITWTYAAAAEIVGRLARGIGAWRLPPGSRIGLWFAGGAESALAHLAVEAAGHLPCLIPATWGEEALSSAIEAAGLVAVLTEGRRGGRRPAEEITLAALRHFGLRYLAAFGPSLVDGVISLDALALERGVVDPRPSLGVVTFAGADPARPVHRTAAALAAAVAAHREPSPGPERILTLLPGHDLRGLVTGLGAALASGAALESVIPFEATALAVALTRPMPTRLVVPAAFEPTLAEMTLPWTVRALDVVHRAPARLPEAASDPDGPPRLDVLVLDEDAVITRPRGRLGVATEAAAGPDAASPVLLRREDGRLLCAGLAACAAPLRRTPIPAAHDAALEAPPEAGPRETAYRAVLRQGALSAVIPS